MKFLLAILITSMLPTTPLMSLTTTQLSNIFYAYSNSPFYPNITLYSNINLKVYKGTNSWWTTLSDKDTGTYYRKYTDFVKDESTFYKYYKSITFEFSALSSSSGFGRNQSYSGPITLSLASSNRDYDVFKWSQNRTQNQASNLAQILIQPGALAGYLWFTFYVECWMYQGGNSSWTDTTSELSVTKITINSNQNLATIKSNLQSNLSRQINFESDYSGALDDKRNITDPTGKGNDLTTKINSVINSVLGNDYYDWKQYIQPYSFNNSTRQSTIVIKFINPTSKQQEVWTFYTPINITLSSGYWGKSLRERLHIMPGQIVNPQDSTQGMIPDTGIQLEPSKVTPNYGGNIQYHTTAHIEFDGSDDSTEWMTVNGEKVEVLNNKFIYNMIDERVDKGPQGVNVFDIIVYHDDGKYKSQYQIKYTIANLVPTLEQKWYAWNPTKNPEQNALIQPTIDGKPNPKYDKEVNKTTGTKTQIIWVKKKSEYPFALDPLNQNGEVINPNVNPKDYDLGFITEGSVTGMGVQQLFDKTQVDSVRREGVDNKLTKYNNPNDKQKLTQIESDADNKYWSWEGIWHYVTKTNDGLAYEKYVLIGCWISK
ncbi:Mbov_0399 family ICE element protein [Spiroplasma sp. SV19]|uniref:Mbov_0399 family ICE element protein n=1 Tax=Spiroplasma sp. SV19 TaxID=2570468 RepID=UPI0024B78F77|nr:hypothetical protein [Spiroplasma sp. SV19]WHQ37368.1 hypothetical protein E7Y35_05825 [Spiroplasma sp. SV19]